MDNMDDMNNNEDSSYAIKTWIVVAVASIVTFILVFTITNALINGGKKKVKTTEEKKPEVVVTYDAYKIGDSVSLKDGSSWHVLYDSSKTNEFVSLLSDVDVNSGEILYGKINSYLKGTFKNSLVSALKAESSDIQELRLLAYLDLADLSKANSTEFQPETPLVKFNIPEFVYATETVTDTVYQTEEGNNPMMLCLRKDNNPNRFCIGDAAKPLPVRPVLVISKKYVESNGVNDNTVGNDPITNNSEANSATNNTETNSTAGNTNNSQSITNSIIGH